MKFLQYIAFSIIFLLLSSTANATFLTMTLTQEKSGDLKGWRIYYAVHVTDQAPNPPVSPDSYDEVIEFIGFSGPGTEMDIASRPWGLYIKPYPGYEEYYWEPELTFYVPGSPTSENKTVYFIATAFDLSNLESDPSDVLPYPVAGPGTPLPPEVNYKHSEVVSNGQVEGLQQGIEKPDGSYTRILSIKKSSD